MVKEKWKQFGSRGVRKPMGICHTEVPSSCPSSVHTACPLYQSNLLTIEARLGGENISDNLKGRIENGFSPFGGEVLVYGLPLRRNQTIAVRELRNHFKRSGRHLVQNEGLMQEWSHFDKSRKYNMKEFLRICIWHKGQAGTYFRLILASLSLFLREDICANSRYEISGCRS
ncbi:hypothetical protein Ancab_040273 [Ancistrocladus abbreviatus]